ncbi:MAG: tetratricopeptide repeat protein, partial [Propionibacteriaceae bacterium]|nr:tetratricopeptide repeat protein [Propionibacteriaceae bacterium]
AREKGDWAKAQDAFARLLKDNPADALAKAGQAQSGLLGRVAADPAADTAPLYADAHPDDVTAQLRAADFEVAAGRPDAGFARLTAAVARSAGPDRDTLRTRLLELFDTLDPADPIVLKARRDLATALF